MKTFKEFLNESQLVYNKAAIEQRMQSTPSANVKQTVTNILAKIDKAADVAKRGGDDPQQEANSSYSEFQLALHRLITQPSASDIAQYYENLSPVEKKQMYFVLYGKEAA